MHPDAQCNGRIDGGGEHNLEHFIIVQQGSLYPDRLSTVYTDADHWPGMVESGYECRTCGVRLDVIGV